MIPVAAAQETLQYIYPVVDSILEQVSYPTASNIEPGNVTANGTYATGRKVPQGLLQYRLVKST